MGLMTLIEENRKQANKWTDEQASKKKNKKPKTEKAGKFSVTITVKWYKTESKAGTAAKG